MSIIWTYADIVLTKLRTVKQYYQIDAAYYRLIIYDYIRPVETVNTFVGEKDSTYGVDE